MSEQVNAVLYKKSKVEKVVFSIVLVIFIAYGLSMVYPFIWAFISSLKTNAEYMNNAFSLPADWKFVNYITAFKELNYNDTNFFMMTFNSIWFTLGTTLISVTVVCMTAYVVAKYKFRGRQFIYGISVFIMIIPVVGNLPASYKLMNALGLVDSPLILLSAAGGFGFNFIIMYGFFKSLPWSYAEAAKMDGASHLQIFFKVMLPQVFTSVFAIALICMINVWNDYMTPILYLPNWVTLAAGLFNYQTIIIYQTNYPIYFAGVLLSMLPILIIYSIFHNVIMENTVAGGLKG